MEIWKPVTGYEGLYEVSNEGRFRSLDRYTEQLNNGVLSRACYRGKSLKGHKDNRGYIQVHVSKNGKHERILVHRAVADAFCVRPNGCDVVNHLDNDPSNNAANNLEWTTYEGNMQWAAKQGRMRFHPGNLAKAQAAHNIPVIAVDKSGNECLFPSQTIAAKELGLSDGQRKHIAAACVKRYGYKTVGGYEWRYAESPRGRC